jgi:hypothetical protein
MNLQPINTTEALIASVDAALARCDRKIGLAQIAIDRLNESVASQPEQLEFEARIRARTSGSIVYGYPCACSAMKSQCNIFVSNEGWLCGFCIQDDHSGHF